MKYNEEGFMKNYTNRQLAATSIASMSFIFLEICKDRMDNPNAIAPKIDENIVNEVELYLNALDSDQTVDDNAMRYIRDQLVDDGVFQDWTEDAARRLLIDTIDWITGFKNSEHGAINFYIEILNANRQLPTDGHPSIPSPAHIAEFSILEPLIQKLTFEKRGDDLTLDDYTMLYLTSLNQTPEISKFIKIDIEKSVNDNEYVDYNKTIGEMRRHLNKMIEYNSYGFNHDPLDNAVHCIIRMLADTQVFE